MDTKAGMMALDIEDIQTHRRAQRVINGLLSSKGKMYRTARGRLAIQISPETYERIKGQLKITLSEGLDGTRLVTIDEEVEKPVVAA